MDRLRQERPERHKAHRLPFYRYRRALLSDLGNKIVNPQRQIAQALAGRMVNRVGERR